MMTDPLIVANQNLTEGGINLRFSFDMERWFTPHIFVD